jgi:two-component system NtrC family sensor kinase
MENEDQPTAGRILVVDDEARIVELLREVLVGQGYEVDSAADAQGALDLIRENIYDAAFLDFNLPDMDGVMLHHEIRQMDPELGSRTIFMSGLVQSEDNLGYYAAYGSGFLPKPFEVRDVLSAVRRVVDGAGE